MERVLTGGKRASSVSYRSQHKRKRKSYLPGKVDVTEDNVQFAKMMSKLRHRGVYLIWQVRGH